MAIIAVAGAETWIGRHPALTARTVLEIARQAELAFDHVSHYNSMTSLLGAYNDEPILSQVGGGPLFTTLRARVLAFNGVELQGAVHLCFIFPKVRARVWGLAGANPCGTSFAGQGPVAFRATDTTAEFMRCDPDSPPCLPYTNKGMLAQG